MSMDLIDRQAAKQAFESKYPKNYAGNFEFGGMSCIFSLIEMRKILDSVPSAMKWIPCKERLPERKQIVLCSTGDYTCAGYYNGYKFYVANNELWDSWTWEPNIIAWMPLPEPYKKV